jgi:hypothetical protein
MKRRGKMKLSFVISHVRVLVLMLALFLIYGCGPGVDYDELTEAAESAQNSINNFRPGRGHSLNSFQELVDRAYIMAEEKAAAQKEVDNVIKDLHGWQKWFDDESWREPMPPIPLIESGTNIVKPPEGVHPFYKKYLNVYEDDYTKGIPILSSARVDDRALLKIRSTILKMLSKRPDVRDEMVANKERIVVRAVLEESWNHPEFRFRSEGGGASPDFPTTLIEEEGVYFHDENGNLQPRFLRARFEGRFLIVEEFLHSMHFMGMPFVEDGENILQEIRDAYVNAVKKGLFDPEAFYDESISGTERVPLTDLSRREELESYLTERHIRRINPEYLAICAEIYFGGVVPTGDHKAKNREQLKQYDPTVYEILTRYFYEDDWHPYDPIDK